MEKISWTENVRSKALQSGKEDRNILYTIQRRKLTWLNTKYITGSQNTTKFIALCCTICYTTMFQPFFRPSSGCIRLALRVIYPGDKVYYFDDEISILL